MAEQDNQVGIPEGGFKDREQLEAWLEDQPREVAIAIAWRSAARVFPLLAGERLDAVILPALRAIAVSRFAANWPSYQVVHVAITAGKVADDCIHARLISRAKDLTNAVGVAAFSASRMNKISAASYCVATSAMGAASAATRDYADAYFNAVWLQTTLDAEWYAERGIQALNDAALWFVFKLSEPVLRIGNSVREGWERLRRELIDSPEVEVWTVWINWYNDILHGKPGPTRDRDIEFARLFGHPEAGVEITEDDWKAGPSVVNPKIRQVLDWFSSPKIKEVDEDSEFRELIVGCLREIQRYAQLSEIRDFVLSKRPGTLRSDIENQLYNLVADEVVHEVRPGVYRLQSNADIAEGVDAQPAEPAPGPGPNYAPVQGKLDIVASTPQVDEAAAQQALHGRLRSKVEKLTGALASVRNQYPELAHAVEEYADLVAADTSDLDVTGVWSVGGALAEFVTAYRNQNPSATMAVPLEPQLAAGLSSIVRDHGAFILGFAEGRELVESADDFALRRELLQELQTSGQPILEMLASNRALVSDKARQLHKTVLDTTHEFGWASSRVGYTAYVTVRKAIFAMIRHTVGEGRKPIELIAILGGADALVGQPTAEFIRAAIPILRDHGPQLLAFFNHSPEFRAWVEWALKIVHSAEQLRDKN